MSATGWPNGENKSPKHWIREAEKFKEDYYAIVRQFGNNGFEWIADDSKSLDIEEHTCSNPTGYLNSGGLPLWEGGIFITNELERLYKMWKRCQNEGTHHYRIVKLNLSVEPVNHELVEAQMKIAARDEVLSKLSEEDREIIMSVG